MAHQYALIDQNHNPGMIAHTGTANDSETVRVVASTAGALSVDIVSGEIIASLGTIGSLQNVGTLGSLANVGVIHNAGTLAGGSIGTIAGIAGGSIANIGVVHNAGTIAGGSIGTIAGLAGTVKVDLATRIDGTNDSIAITSGTIQNSGSTTGVGTITNIGTLKGIDSVAELVKGTITNVGSVGTITGIAGGSITNIGVIHNAGTLATGSLANIAYIHQIGTMPAISIGESTGGTLDLLTDGTVQIKGGTVVTTMGDLAGGTIDILTAGTVTQIGTILGIGGTVETTANVSMTDIPGGTLDLVTGLGTLGSISNIAVIHNAGTLAGGSIGTIAGIAGGSIANIGVIHNAGTVTSVTSVANLVKGTITEVEGGTLDLVTGLGTLGSISNIAKVHNAGTVAGLPDLPGGTIDQSIIWGNSSAAGTGTNYAVLLDSSGHQQIDLQTGTVTAVSSVAELVKGTVTAVTSVAELVKGTVTSVGSVLGIAGGSLANIAKIHNAGTLADGSLSQVGTLFSGSLSQLGTIYGGTVNVGGGSVGTILGIAGGSLANIGVVHNAGSVAALPDLPGGTVDNLGTLVGAGTLTNVGSLTNVGTVKAIDAVTSVTNVVTGTLSSVKINATPAGSTILTNHVLGTGGTIWGTLLANAGAGTSVYLTGVQIVGHSGTCDYAITNNVAGSTGAGVYARGLFPPGGGIARDFGPAINCGAAGTLCYLVNGNGTASFIVNYWVSP